MSNADHLRDANPWHPMTNVLDLAHLGKLAEEICEASEALFVCLANGINNVSGDELENELVDVDVTALLVISHFGLSLGIPYQLPRAETLPNRLALFGRALSDAGAAVARCIIQGIDECDPVSATPNRLWLEEALGVVFATRAQLLSALNRADVVAMARQYRRQAKKAAHLRQWHSMIGGQK